MAHNKELNLSMDALNAYHKKNLETRLKEMWQNNSGCLWIRIKVVLFHASLHFLMLSCLFSCISFCRTRKRIQDSQTKQMKVLFNPSYCRNGPQRIVTSPSHTSFFSSVNCGWLLWMAIYPVPLPEGKKGTGRARWK